MNKKPIFEGAQYPTPTSSIPFGSQPTTDHNLQIARNLYTQGQEDLIERHRWHHYADEPDAENWILISLQHKNGTDFSYRLGYFDGINFTMDCVQDFAIAEWVDFKNKRMRWCYAYMAAGEENVK